MGNVTVWCGLTLRRMWDGQCNCMVWTYFEADVGWAM